LIGGNFDVIPPITSTNVDGSVLSAISASRSVYPLTVAVTLSEFSGVVNGSGLANFTRLILNPDVGGFVNTTPYTRLDITNPSTLTGIYGRPYQTEFNANGDTNGYTQKEADDTAKQLAFWLFIAFWLLVGLGIVLNQNIMSRYRTAQKLRKATY
jgi:hypothetical protein